MSYWSQYSYDEVMSMHGVEDCGEDDIESVDSDSNESEKDEFDDCCSRGCKHCLMTEW